MRKFNIYHNHGIMISSSGHRTSSGSGLHIFQTSIIYFLFEKKYLIFSFSKTSDIYAIEVLLIALRHQIFKLIASQHFQFRIVSLAKRTGTLITDRKIKLFKIPFVNTTNRNKKSYD